MVKDMTTDEYNVCIEEELFRAEKIRHQFYVLVFGFFVTAVF